MSMHLLSSTGLHMHEQGLKMWSGSDMHNVYWLLPVVVIRENLHAGAVVRGEGKHKLRQLLQTSSLYICHFKVNTQPKGCSHAFMKGTGDLKGKSCIAQARKQMSSGLRQPQEEGFRSTD